MLSKQPFPTRTLTAGMLAIQAEASFSAEAGIAANVATKIGSGYPCPLSYPSPHNTIGEGMDWIRRFRKWLTEERVPHPAVAAALRGFGW
jgi:hypothetical protein